MHVRLYNQLFLPFGERVNKNKLIPCACVQYYVGNCQVVMVLYNVPNCRPMPLEF